MNIEQIQPKITILVMGLLVLLAAGRLAAQSPGTGAISGKVVDRSGAVIADAHVSAMSEKTATTRTVATTAGGSFSVALLPPGDYSLVVGKSGFQSKTLRSIHVTVTEE